MTARGNAIDDAAAPRLAAAAALARWFRNGEFPSRTVTGDGALALEIAHGALRNLAALDFAISGLCQRKPGADARCFLLVGLWQVLFSDSIPGYAAIDATVEAAKRYRRGSVQPGFVNAVLRSAVRQSGELLREISLSPPHIRFSLPEALVGRWIGHFGDGTAMRLCAAAQAIPPVAAIPLPFCDPAALESLEALWRDRGIEAVRAWEGRGLAVPRGLRVDALPGYAEGLFAIQDPATLLSVSMLAPARGETILDCCAAPGGKTLQMAAIVGDEGRVLAFDSAGPRLQRLAENAGRARLGHRIETAVCDASLGELLERLSGRRIDAVLADVPCSNSGVLARRPEARWRWSPDETDRLAAVQLSILRNASRLGARRMVYSTCSIAGEENEAVVAAFLDSPEGERWTLVRSETLLPLPSENWNGGKFLPDDWHDGAFAALLRHL